MNPHDVLETHGTLDAQKYLSEEVQKVYCMQGVYINLKHVEIIVKQMTRKLNITEMGDSDFIPNTYVDINKFEKENRLLIDQGKLPSKGKVVLLGITRASLNTESFISASSFQQTATVLTKSAIVGDQDNLLGLKENVIIGKLIPAGTGFSSNRCVGVEHRD